MSIHLILGTAGHIDHGKTALVRALTGIDTDRLPEEKKRGITIDLGFAELELGDYRLGIVDVPGHERFVRNMLAGATGIDVAVLVVAADDSVKQQTREHLEILRLLDLSAGVIALTKCDVAEEEWIDLVEAEVRDLVQDTFLAEAPIVRTSAATGMGIEPLKEQLLQAIASHVKTDRLRSAGPFRMAVDGVFSLAGHGTIARGSVLRGSIAVGNEVEVQPQNQTARIRSLQTHGREVERIERGQRAAINLAGIALEEISRGSELASPKLLRASRILGVELNPLPSARRGFKHRQTIRIHLGTTEVLARILLKEQEDIPPGHPKIAQLLLEKPVTTTWGQPFVVRSESPIRTIGGGRILAPELWRFRRKLNEDWEQLEYMRSKIPLERAAAAVYFFRWQPWQLNDLNRAAGIDEIESVHAQLQANDGQITQLRLSPTRQIEVHHRHLARFGRDAVKALEKLHETHPKNLNFPQSQLEAKFRFLQDRSLTKAVIAQLAEQNVISLTAQGVALPGYGPRLSQKESQLLAEILQKYLDGGFRPPSVDEIQNSTTHHRQSVPKLIELAAAQGTLIRLNDSLYLHNAVEERLRSHLRTCYPRGEGFTISAIREALDVSRKYAVPICEHLDRIGFTRRDGDLRVIVGATENTPA